MIKLYVALLVAFVNFGAGLASKSHAFSLERVKIAYLQGNYHQAITEGEQALAGLSSGAGARSELYYLLGLSYSKSSELARAADYFEKAQKASGSSNAREAALLSLGDTYLLREDLPKAEEHYTAFINANAHSKLKAQAYHRLSQLCLRKGDTQKARQYIERLKKEFPFSSENDLSFNQCAISPQVFSLEIFYSVQVGSFSKEGNARNLAHKLVANGFPAYIEEGESKDAGKMYRVKVGKTRQRSEAVEFKEKLSQQGYPTKICP